MHFKMVFKSNVDNRGGWGRIYILGMRSDQIISKALSSFEHLSVLL